MPTVLIVDDVPAMGEQYAYDLRRMMECETRVVLRGQAALEALDEEPMDCVLLDLEMPGMDGFGVLQAIRERGITVPVIVYTGTGNYDRCMRAVRMGAYTFLDKSEPMERVVRELENAIAQHRLAGEVERLRARTGEDSPLLGESAAMQELRDAVAKLAEIPSPVFIMGESGTGKELVARELHRLSGRGPWVPINAAALPETLVESELFGHERGAFTGADRARRGAFETASGGTLFLDEIAELPMPAQAKMLRVLENREVVRVGGNKVLAVDARVVAATNRDLELEIREGRFREDLYFRLAVHCVTVPALRERTEDVPLLVTHFMETISQDLGRAPKKIAPEAMAALIAWPWSRNNVRELRNTVERMIIASGAPVAELSDLPGELRGKKESGGTGVSGTLKDRKMAAERAILLEALRRHDWHITDTAADLGLADHASLLKIMRRHGIKRP